LLLAFAKYPRLPRLLKLDPLARDHSAGVSTGTIRVTYRQDRTAYQLLRQDVSHLPPNVIKELEIVLPEYAELSEISVDLLLPGRLPALWEQAGLSMLRLYQYFAGGHSVHPQRGV